MTTTTTIATTTDDQPAVVAEDPARDALAREALERIARLPMRLGEWRVWGQGYIERVGGDLDGAIGAARAALAWTAEDAAAAHAKAALDAAAAAGPGTADPPLVTHRLTVSRKRWESATVRVRAPADADAATLRALAEAAAWDADWDDGDAAEESTVVVRADTGEEL